MSSTSNPHYIGDYLVPQGEGLQPDVVRNDPEFYPYDGGRRRKTRGRKTKKRR